MDSTLTRCQRVALVGEALAGEMGMHGRAGRRGSDGRRRTTPTAVGARVGGVTRYDVSSTALTALPPPAPRLALVRPANFSIITPEEQPGLPVPEDDEDEEDEPEPEPEQETAAEPDTAPEEPPTNSNAINDALAEVRRSGALDVPMHLRNAPTRLLADLGASKGYCYPHDDLAGARAQPYLPKELKGRRYYIPSDSGAEKQFHQNLQNLRPMAD